MNTHHQHIGCRIKRMAKQIACIVFTLILSNISVATNLLESSPKAGETLVNTPKMIRVMFDETVNGEDLDLRLIGPSVDAPILGAHTMGKTELMVMLDKKLTDKVKSGDYVIQWSLDKRRGQIPFRISLPEDFVPDSWELPLDIGIVLYNGAEPLDVFGPLEMWMNAGPDNIRVHLIAETTGLISLTTTSYPPALAPKVEASFDFHNAPDLDVLMVPGGVGTFTELDNPAMINFLQRASRDVAVVTSVCTGSALYAKAGLLDGVKATGNKAFFDFLVAQGPAEWDSDARWVESGRFLTSSGVSAGIDMSLAVIARFFGIDVARMIANATEYVWNEDSNLDPFVKNLNSATPHVQRIKEKFDAQTP